MLPKKELPAEEITGKGTSSTRAYLSCTYMRLPAAEVCFETRTINLPTGNLFRDILNLAAAETLRRGIPRSTFPENCLWISPQRLLPPACVRPNALARSSLPHTG